ncbi:unnamed protein product [Prunus armeniaca]|uniref:Uncharacterized protein n=1 Tax=Prunus armeniaca TaxID=36596 RepID=A0A6J5UB88_PRUAR|nr:unnamed protein product [Prunus armeniaca]CAB4304015.1 unnamed protein product [Prunus armeniaca]
MRPDSSNGVGNSGRDWRNMRPGVMNMRPGNRQLGTIWCDWRRRIAAGYRWKCIWIFLLGTARIGGVRSWAGLEDCGRVLLGI